MTGSGNCGFSRSTGIPSLPSDLFGEARRQFDEGEEGGVARSGGNRDDKGDDDQRQHDDVRRARALHQVNQRLDEADGFEAVREDTGGTH